MLKKFNESIKRMCMNKTYKGWVWLIDNYEKLLKDQDIDRRAKTMERCMVDKKWSEKLHELAGYDRRFIELEFRMLNITTKQLVYDIRETMERREKLEKSQN